MIAVIILCAGLCALTCGWVFGGVQSKRGFYSLACVTAVASLSLYLLLGRPDLPAHPTPENTQTRMDMKKEAELMSRLEKNPEDADSMIRLAALRILEGRTGIETEKLLNRAEVIRPKDTRIKVIRSMIEYPNPD